MFLMDQASLEGLSREELIKLVLKQQEEIECLKLENQELKQQLASLPLKGGFRAKLLFKPSVKHKSKKPGQKEGHEGESRPMPEKIHEEKELVLDRCPECGSEVKEVEIRFRVVEGIKPAQPHNVRYSIHRCYCKHCDKIVEPKPDDVIPHCRFDLTLMLYILILRYAMRLPYNRIAKLLYTCFGIKASEGALVGAVKMLARYLGEEYERLKEEVRQLKYVHVDETGWRVNGSNQWLWDFVGKKVALYRIHERRNSKVVEETLGEYEGILTSDFYTAYSPLAYKKQKCWSHLLSDTKELAQESKEGEKMHRSLKRLYADAKQAAEFDSREERVEARRRLERRLDRIASCEYASEKCKTMAERLKKHREEMFTFVEESIEGNNNPAERGLRGSVVMRKISGGNRSDAGAKAHEVIMSVMQTCESRGVDFFAYAQDLISRQLQIGK